MSLIKLIPEIFYSDIKVGIQFFVEGLGFKIVYNNPEKDFYIIKRNDVMIHLFENTKSAKNDRPEIRIETDNIESFYNEIKEKSPPILHPNLNKIKQQPWGLKEFALLDETKVCVIIQQG